MKRIEKIKAEKIIRRIERRCFDENDIDALFLKLRPYSKGFGLFREVSDFAAHYDKRNKGVSTDALQLVYLRMLFFNEYNATRKPLDIGEPFPLWVRRLMVMQVDRADKSVLKEKFGVTPERLKKRIETAFKVDKKKNISAPYNRKVIVNNIEAIEYILSFLYGGPTFTQGEIIDEVVSVLNANGVQYNEDRLRSLSDEITMCIILLFHKGEYDLGDGREGTTNISAEREQINHNVEYMDIEGNKVDMTDEHGMLYVSGYVDVPKGDGKVCIGTTLMTTRLKVERWCDESLFTIKEEVHGKFLHQYKCVDLSGDMALSEDFKLVNGDSNE